MPKPSFGSPLPGMNFGGGGGMSTGTAFKPSMLGMNEANMSPWQKVLMSIIGGSIGMAGGPPGQQNPVDPNAATTQPATQINPGAGPVSSAMPFSPTGTAYSPGNFPNTAPNIPQKPTPVADPNAGYMPQIPGLNWGFDPNKDTQAGVPVDNTPATSMQGQAGFGQFGGVGKPIANRMMKGMFASG